MLWDFKRNNTHFFSTAYQSDSLCVCAILSNFGPALVSSSEMPSEDDADAHFQECKSDDSEASYIDQIILF